MSCGHIGGAVTCAQCGGVVCDTCGSVVEEGCKGIREELERIQQIASKHLTDARAYAGLARDLTLIERAASSLLVVWKARPERT